MGDSFRHNHYVPQWYQKRFVPGGQVDQELFYLDLKPEPYVDLRGVRHPRKNPRRQGFRHCFAQRDLYTAMIFGIETTEVEKRFFGSIDSAGLKAVDYFANFAHPWDGTHLFQELTRYMSTQKLRTPKGLSWLAQVAGTRNKTDILALMIQLQQLYSVIWAECVWLIADAATSQTKFIISDHPVTIYNRRCGPHSQWCRGNNDPDIRYHGSHTLFPLSLEKILILTNLSWVRNPYQSETEMRPNPDFFHETIFSILDIQTVRHLTEPEVREINFIIKSRAPRYIAAAREEWLYPEDYVSRSDWHDYGNGYLLMPDPRGIMFSTETIVQFEGGATKALDEYGRRPGHPEYSARRKNMPADWQTFHRFQGEFATLFGPKRRGRAFHMMKLDNEQDTADFHQYHLNLFKKRKT